MWFEYSLNYLMLFIFQAQVRYEEVKRESLKPYRNRTLSKDDIKNDIARIKSSNEIFNSMKAQKE